MLFSSAAACLLGTSGYCYFSGTPWFYSYVIMASTKWIDPERAHRLAVSLAAKGIVPKDCGRDSEVLVSLYYYLFYLANLILFPLNLVDLGLL